MKHYYNVKNYARTPEIRELPSLIDVQKKSFEDFFYGGRLKELFDEINPIQSFNENLSLYFPGNHPEAQEFDFSEPPLEHRPYRLLNETQRPKKGLQIYMQKPKYDEEECIERDMSYAAPLYVQVALVNHEQGDEIIRQTVFLGEFPLMTEKGTFIINGTERVVVSQLIRSPGVYFDVEEERATGRLLSNAKMIPDRGAWMEFETKRTDYITIKFNRKRTIPVTVLLRALAAVDDGLPAKLSPIKTGEDEEILALFADVDSDETHKFIEGCFKNEPDWTAAMKKHKTKEVSEAALIEFFNKMRPGDPEKLESAREYLAGQLFDQRRYDLERVGRYKLNQRLAHKEHFSKRDFGKIERHRTIIKADIVKLVEHMIRINNGDRAKDDIDHLGNRRVKTVGELIGNKLRIGMRRMERVVKERMSIREAEQLTPVSLVNIRPIVAAVREFFGSSQLSQFMEQTNPLSELTHKRTLSALGPGGLRRERAGFDVRDVHHSHYGRICPIETPEGPNIGLIGRLASYARVNELGFIETPYRQVVNSMAVQMETTATVPTVADVSQKVVKSRKISKSLLGCTLAKDIEVVVAIATSDNPLDILYNEVSAGDGVFAKLNDEKKKRSAGDFSGFKDADMLESHLSLVRENVELYCDTRKRAIERLDQHAVLKEQAIESIDAEKLQTNLCDLRSHAKAYSEALEEFVRVDSLDSSSESARTGEFNQLLIRVGNFSEALRRAGRDIESKITDANSHLPQESQIDLKPTGETSRRIKAETIVDDEILNLLQESGSKSVTVVDKVPNTDLLECELSADVRIGRSKPIAEKGAIIDESILRVLLSKGVETVKVSLESVKVVDNPELIGRVIRDDIENSRGKVFIEEGTVIDKKTVTRLKRSKVKEVPVVPFATHEISYLSADDEDKFIIAQANARLDDRDQFISNRVSARYEQGFVSVAPQRIDYMDIAPRQIVGISAALIPFLSHDAANRALMGSNMQRQAVPLITPDVSVVSTGMERQAASDSGQVLMSDIEAEVISVQGHRVIVRTADGEEHTFQLRKYERSNQSTCIDQRPVVHKGDWIKPGDIVADSSSTYDGHLALGHDVLTCFLSWDGGNYEDALLVGEDMLRNDKFTSIHIEKHEIEARDTKLGAEEITYDIPNVGEDALKDLDEHGIVRIGAEVGPNDILVGKITPKGEKELSPEEKLLRAIFGEQAREVRDSSLRLPHGDRGKVIDVKVFTREEHPDLSAGVEKMVRVSVAQRRKLTVGDKMAGRHGNKGVISKIVTVEDMPYIEGGIPVEIILNPLGVPSRMNIGQILELHLGWAADRLGFRAITPVFDGVKEQEIQAELGRAWMIDWAWKLTTERAWESHERLAEAAGIAPDDFDDDMHVICAYLVDRVGESGLYDNEAIILERDEIYVRRVAVAEMLREFGHDPDAVMVYDNSELSSEERDNRDARAIDVSIRLWIQHHAAEGVELSDELSVRELFEVADRVMFETNIPVPHYGKHTLYDGRTGEPFDRHVAVGYVHMLKLAHLVEDKAHARSTGPYSLVTQQPLGGKAQFGGQRFGEMEVWALEAYGAAHILQEMLTVKSDDVQGRVKTYESIVKGEPIEEPGIPTSFRVLVKELQSLGLSVEAITGSGDVIRFGKYDEQSRKPQPETGLLGLGTG